ncbi:hypothetical protein DNH61_03505 [Paenibacillus sambharensis]|uniref:Uncharacterized protein n=1 Tax=Paenibacillus sambharensis TaxID=1803190 RepID=A0A2W1LRF7_9BACL|nr:hypothetical protein [Paenibacillus sambharensis]PZD97425.1 hypothetical protein DNH61_03505 [Paenibacillus sambharensis]
MKQIVLWSLLIVPWASLLLLKPDTIRRYMPVALLMTIIHTLTYQAAYYYNWWNESKSSLFGWDRIMPVPWVYGAYLIVVIWVFRFTYGQFWLYLTVNLVMDGLFMYLAYPLLGRLGFVSAESSLPTIAIYAMMIGFSLIIYLYHMWQNDIFKAPEETSKERQRTNWPKLHLRRKAR